MILPNCSQFVTNPYTSVPFFTIQCSWRARPFCLLDVQRVVILTENQRVKGSDSAQTSFKQLLLRLRNGKTTKVDWNCLLGRKPIHVEDMSTFYNATRLFYSNDDVATFNYNQLINIPGSIAQINARHSSDKVNKISAQDLYGLEPSLFLKGGAVVMLTMNLRPSTGLCNGSTGTIVGIVYSHDSQPQIYQLLLLSNLITIQDLPFRKTITVFVFLQ